MSDANPNFAIRQFIPGPAGVAIVAPIACTQVVLENTDLVNTIQVYTDPQNITPTTKNIPAGLELTLRGSVICWGPGSTVCFATGGNNLPVTCTFLR